MTIFIVVRDNTIIKGETHNIVHVFATEQEAREAVARYEAQTIDNWKYSVVRKNVL